MINAPVAKIKASAASMALGQRPGARFFAAFYRWSCYTQLQAPCTNIARQTGFHRTATLQSSRSYRTTRPYRQKEATFAQRREEETNTAPEDWLQEEAQDTLDESYAQPPNEESVAEAQKMESSAAPEVVSDNVKAQLEEARAVFLKEFGQSQDEEAGVEEGRQGKRHIRHGAPRAEDPQEATKPLRDRMRTLMRQVPSSVAVITVAHVDADTGYKVPLGSAVSSLNTVTLDPPTVSFNIKFPSKTLDAIRAAEGRFRVHMFSPRVKSAQIVELFTQGNHAKAYKLRRQSIPIFIPPSRDARNATESLAPQIWDGTVAAAMECELTQELTVADHVIAVAKVVSMTSKNRQDSTLLYHDGKYKRADTAPVLHQHRVPKSEPAPADPAVGMYWRYRLFPGEEEKKDCIYRLKEEVKKRGGMRDRQIRTAARDLFKELSIPRGSFGLNAWHLIGECRKELGHEMGMEPWMEHTATFADFYGRLNPSDIAQIVDRARQLVQEDPRCLNLHYKLFLTTLGVEPSYYGLLPSDILNPLRAEGLVGPLERQSLQVTTHDSTATIEAVEQYEHKLRDYFRTQTYNTVMQTNVKQIEKAIDEEDGWGSPYLTLFRERLAIETWPDLFSAPHIDIFGAVNPEEGRVVVGRIIDFLNIDSMHECRKKITAPRIEALRQVGVHPFITGINIDYLFGKLLFMYKSINGYRSFVNEVGDVLKPLFAHRVAWADLESRVKDLVKNMPLKVVSWSRKDLLAALGLSQNCTTKPPLAADRRPLLKGHILPALFARELKAYYGSPTATEEENAAIATFLKEKYKYTVQMPVSVSPSDSMKESENSKSSDEELADAMWRNLNVHVMHSEKVARDLELVMMGVGGRFGRDVGEWKKVDGRVVEVGEVKWTGYGIDGKVKE